MRAPSCGGPFGLGLLLFSIAAAAYGMAYVFPTPEQDVPDAIALLSAYVPLQAWGALWVAAALMCAWRSLRPPQSRADVVPLIVITHLWGTAYMVWWGYEGLWLGVWSRDWRGWMLFSGISTLLIVWSRLVNPPVIRAAG